MGGVGSNQKPDLQQDITALYGCVKTEDDIEKAIKLLLASMTLDEKIGQMKQYSYDGKTLDPDFEVLIARGEVGSVLFARSVTVVNAMQQAAMEKSRLKIPIIVGRDVIHGYRTIMPIPLAQAASFNADLVERAARIAAIEATTSGARWTFSPMIDIARDPRWGRIAQSFGEDPYLAGKLGTAMVKGYQTSNLKDITAMAACGKHFVGYGAAEGGRDYNTTLIPENTLRDIYLTPFKQVSKNGCQTFMSAFNDLNGVPASGNDFTLKKVLRQEWNFDGFVVSDWQSVSQMIQHGFCQDNADAAEKAINSGVDMEMVSPCYNNIPQLLDQGRITLDTVDKCVSNILRVKFRLDLFTNWKTDPSRQSILLDKKHLDLAKSIALQSAVLLQNNDKGLPLSKTVKSLAVIGPLADDGENQIGCWAIDSKGTDSVTPLKALKQLLPTTTINVAKGFKNCQAQDDSMFAQAIDAAKKSDTILMFMGEDNGMSGQNHNRTSLDLPGLQLNLIQQMSKIGKPVILVLYAGRSLLVNKAMPLVKSILYVWQLGTMSGPAIVDLLFGVTVPSGKLPITFPRELGQIPIYYNKKNTGRPNNTHEYIPYTSSYLDIDPTPLFPFGYGLSYTTFTYSQFKLSKTSIAYGETLIASAVVKNEGAYLADEVSMFFVRDLVGSYTRPVKELKGFKRNTLKPGQSTVLTFVISADDLAFWTRDKSFKPEVGKFMVWIGPSSQAASYGQFELTSVKEQDTVDIIEVSE